MMNFLLHIVITLGHMIPFALAYNLVFGKGKIFHFGPICTSLIAAYGIFATWYWTHSYLLAIPVAIVLVMLASFVFSRLAVRLQPDGLGVMTLAMHLCALSLVLNWQSVTRGALGIPQIARFPFLNSMQAFAAFAFAGMMVWILIYWLIERSSYSRKLSALAEHDWYARSLGIDKSGVYLIAFVMIGLTQVWDNLLFGQYLHLLTPMDYSYPTLIFIIMIVVAGGPGKMWGVLLSAFLLVVLREAIRFVPMDASILGPTRLILFGFILFVAVWVRRDTLFPKQRTV
jgi:ABC-type branched-subunit amino acid transport system permease subunit